MPFSNGTECQVFQYNVCEKCLHHEYDKSSDTHGCPLMDAFFLYSYGAKGEHKDMIFYLCDGETCRMFKPIGALGQKRVSGFMEKNEDE